jgi:hypothetical protein
MCCEKLCEMGNATHFVAEYDDRKVIPFLHDFWSTKSYYLNICNVTFDAPTIQFEESNIILCLVLEHIIILLSFQHKLNYFLVCWTFEKLFIICAKI